jgi:hypothetical protein
MLNFLKKKTKAFKFNEAENTACFTCIHVLNGEPVLYVSHDKDGDWQFLCGRDGHMESDAKVIALSRMVDIDPTVNDLHEMPAGVGASRETITAKWKPFRNS